MNKILSIVGYCLSKKHIKLSKIYLMFISVKGNGDGNGNAYSPLFYLKTLPLPKNGDIYLELLG